MIEVGGGSKVSAKMESDDLRKEVERLLQRAEQARRLATQVDQTECPRLIDFAQELERDAQKLEAEVAETKQTNENTTDAAALKPPAEKPIDS